MAVNLNNVRIIDISWIPRYQAAGLDATITSLAPQNLLPTDFLSQLNQAISLPAMTPDMLIEYISARKLAGKLQEVEVRGVTLPTTPSRWDAPTGFGQDANAIWFSEPTANPNGQADTLIAIYVNGERRITTRVDLASNRSGAKTALAPLAAGDVVAIALVEDDLTVGWWGTITAN